MPSPRSHRLSRRPSRLILPASIVSASAAALMRRHCGVCSTCWSDDDPDSLWCAGLACGRTNGYEARHERLGPSGSGGPAARSACRRSYVFRGARGNLIKVLWHDGLGMSLYAKRLEKGRFIWPSLANGVVGISASQLAYMLDGIDWRNPVHTFRPERAG